MKTIQYIIITTLSILALLTIACINNGTSEQMANETDTVANAPTQSPPNQKPNKEQKPQRQNPNKEQKPQKDQNSTAPGSFTMEQTLSANAQETTIAFDGLTGNLGSDSFFPPGKVADFWGFQYLRDNDPSEMGHNTDFLTKASLNMFSILSAEQKTQLSNLAKTQVNSINDYGYKRFVLMTAFRRLLAGDLPAGATGLNEDTVKAFSAELYRLDGQISFKRAQVMGKILANLNPEQKAYLAKMVGKGMTSWQNVSEPNELRGLSRDEKVAVMTYAGDLFSWYAGSVEADVYFCPERQGTYFGSFYMKDAPAINNPGYSIDPNLTANMGNAFISALNTEQANLITSLVDIQRSDLYAIVDIREQVSTELRKFKLGTTTNSETVLSLMDEYGKLDGAIIYNYATNFTKVKETLTDAQKAVLMDLRHQTLGDFTPAAAFLYAKEIHFPVVQNTDFLFNSSSLLTYTIFGSVKINGVGLSDVTISMGQQQVITDGNGAFSFSDVPMGTYTLVPSKDYYTFFPSSLSVTITNANLTEQNFTTSQMEKDTLLVLYNATGGSNWTNSWSVNEDFCTWYGVTCTSGNITGLSLSNNYLIGSIPIELSNLTKLGSLYISNNNLCFPASLLTWYTSIPK